MRTTGKLWCKRVAYDNRRQNRTFCLPPLRVPNTTCIEIYVYPKTSTGLNSKNIQIQHCNNMH